MEEKRREERSLLEKPRARPRTRTLELSKSEHSRERERESLVHSASHTLSHQIPGRARPPNNNNNNNKNAVRDARAGHGAENAEALFGGSARCCSSLTKFRAPSVAHAALCRRLALDRERVARAPARTEHLCGFRRTRHLPKESGNTPLCESLSLSLSRFLFKRAAVGRGALSRRR